MRVKLKSGLIGRAGYMCEDMVIQEKKKQVEKFKIYSYVIWNKIIEQEFQNIFCHSLAISIHILVLPLLFYMT